jgi:hypothetical protein
MRTANHQKMLDFQYFSRMDRQFYGTPDQMPVMPQEKIVYGYKDSQELRAEVNHLEKRVNELDGFKRMSHTHSKKGTKYNTYSLEDINNTGRGGEGN